MAYYRQTIGLKGVRAIRKATKPCPVDVHPDEPISTSRINGLVPRGGSFESLFIPRNKKRITWEGYDNTSSAWHDAIRKGLV
jgi:hypothetical protein